ncbi:MAG TPA: DUF2127 domain-containing protein [Chloroflexota bacterium]|jgi:uncharacterized membrane protein (DUF2068 family)
MRTVARPEAEPQRQLFGKPLGIGLIVIQKSLAAIFFGAAAVTLLVLHAKGITHPVQRLFAGELLEDPHDRLGQLLINLVPEVSKSALLGLALGSLAYFVLEVIEAAGLLLGQFWVEVLIVIETALFLPFEAFELHRHFTWLKVATMVINVIILAYLIRRYVDKRRDRLASMRL